MIDIYVKIFTETNDEKYASNLFRLPTDQFVAQAEEVNTTYEEFKGLSLQTDAAVERLKKL